MPFPPISSFDLTNYLAKIQDKTLEIEQESEVLEQAIGKRDAHLIRITQSIQGDLKGIHTRLEIYRAQLELVKKDLLAILKTYKLAARKDEFEKLRQRVDQLAFEKNITRPELKRLISIHTLKH